jgi:hypothetical protein
VVETAGPPEPPDALESASFRRNHPWAVLVDTDGNPETGVSFNEPHALKIPATYGTGDPLVTKEEHDLN